MQRKEHCYILQYDVRVKDRYTIHNCVATANEAHLVRLAADAGHVRRIKVASEGVAQGVQLSATVCNSDSSVPHEKDCTCVAREIPRVGTKIA
eukprot:5253085-Pleurochrysis_carterae.AAC.1